MQAILMTASGAPNVLQWREVPTPTLQSDTQMLVRIKAAGVNPIDTKLRKRGTYAPNRMPTILGCDGAGIVEAIGSGVRRYGIGDAVYFCHGGIGIQPGTYAQYTVIDELFAAPKPTSLSFGEAAAAPLALITAWESLFERASLAANNRVLIHAGTGGVGHLAIQLAKHAGATVYTTVSSNEKAAFVQQLGADYALLYRQEDIVARLMEETHGAGVDIALDTVGGDTFAATFPAVKIYGDLVTLLEPPVDCNWKEARLRNLRISYELMLTPMLYNMTAMQHHQADILARCTTLFDSGELRIHIARQFPLQDAAQAHELIETGSIQGKIVLLSDDI